MKLIRLKTVYYLNWQGITLTQEKPFIEATEKNIEKLQKYIKAGYVEIVEKEEMEKEEIIEIPKIEPIVNLENFEQLNDANITTEIKRIYEYTHDELKALNKAQLIAICEERGLEFKKSFSVAKLEELILKNQ